MDNQRTRFVPKFVIPRAYKTANAQSKIHAMAAKPTHSRIRTVMATARKLSEANSSCIGEAFD
jgi:hypothetical protein